MASPIEWGLDDPEAVQALRNRLEAMTIEELQERQDALIEDINSIRQKREALDQRVEEAKRAIDAARLTSALDVHGDRKSVV